MTGIECRIIFQSHWKSSHSSRGWTCELSGRHFRLWTRWRNADLSDYCCESFNKIRVEGCSGRQQDYETARDAAPPVQHCVIFSTCPWFRTELLHGIKLVTSPSSKNSGTKLRGRTHKMFGISVGISLNNWGTQDWNFRWEFANSVSGWRARGPCARSSRSTAWGTFASGPFLWEVELHHMIVYDMIFRNFCSASQFGRKIFPLSRTFFWINIFW